MIIMVPGALCQVQPAGPAVTGPSDAEAALTYVKCKFQMPEGDFILLGTLRKCDETKGNVFLRALGKCKYFVYNEGY